MKKEEFKSFVRKHPILLKHVQNGSMTWQKFYEIYDMYGEDDSVWAEYLNTSSDSGVFDFVKNIDFDSIQNGVNSLQRVISLLQEVTNKKVDKGVNNYSARPLYKHFED